VRTSSDDLPAPRPPVAYYDNGQIFASMSEVAVAYSGNGSQRQGALTFAQARRRLVTFGTSSGTDALDSGRRAAGFFSLRPRLI
jgi:hypothetical protein